MPDPGTGIAARQTLSYGGPVPLPPVPKPRAVTFAAEGENP